MAEETEQQDGYSEEENPTLHRQLCGTSRSGTQQHQASIPATKHSSQAPTTRRRHHPTDQVLIQEEVPQTHHCRSDRDNRGISIGKVSQCPGCHFWLKLALDTVTQHTITKCFINCGFKELQPVEEEPTTSTDTTDYDQLLHRIPMDEYVSSDLNVATLSSSTQWEEDFLSQLRGEDPEEPEAEEPEEEQQEDTTRPTLTSQQASDYLSQLRDFAMQQKNPELLELITKSLSCMDEI